MNDIILSHKRWQQIFDVQLIIALIITVLELITKKQRNFGNIFQLVFLILFSSYFTIIWLVVGNYLIFNFRQFEILWVLLLWAAYLVLLLPLAILYAGDLRKWFLMLLAVYFLDQQYGPDVSLRISRNLRFLHSVTGQGVIAALALLIIACFLGKAWGCHFNPNLKFIKSRNFQISTFILLLAFAI